MALFRSRGLGAREPATVTAMVQEAATDNTAASTSALSRFDKFHLVLTIIATAGVFIGLTLAVFH